LAPATPAATTMPVAHPLLPTPAAPIAYTLEFQNIEARHDTLGMVENVDGSSHPHYKLEAQRIPVSDEEKRWLLDYFNSIGICKRGNY
jgi:hypothetical protein